MKRILVVDDNEHLREVLGQTLELGGHAWVEAADGQEALERLEREPFDLMLLDLWMPRMNGLEVLERLRGRPDAPRVIVLTTDDRPETVLAAVRGQAFECIVKPFEPDALLERVRAALDAPADPGSIEVLSARPDWVELSVPCDRQVADRLQGLMEQLKTDLSEEVRAGIGQAFRELLLNAIEWGGRLDPRQRVRIAYLRAGRLLLYRIADPGRGFRFERLAHAAVGNPQDRPLEHMETREEKGIRLGGFGILMARALVDELLYNEKQNEVVFIKYLD